MGCFSMFEQRHKRREQKHGYDNERKLQGPSFWEDVYGFPRSLKNVHDILFPFISKKYTVILDRGGSERPASPNVREK